MKLPALKDLSSAVTQTFVRFPFAILCALVATIMGYTLAGLDYSEKELQSELTRAILTMYLGMLAGITCTVFCERYFFRSKTQYVFNILILLFMHYYYYTLPFELQQKEIARFIVLALSSHLALSFAPFLVDNEPNGFWQFNKKIFLRILTSFFFSHVLFAGLALALMAIDNLFDVVIDSKNYLRLYIVIMGLFNTFFFLSGVPDEVPRLNSDKTYPKGLRIFTQFVLLPLIALYLLILYIYGFKIIATQVWPEGWVAWLVIGYSVSGILAFLLIWPMRLNKEYQWIKTYTRFFYMLLFPLIVLLFAALWKRIDQYGITEHRYFVFILACWLTVIATYFLFSRIKNIKVIPMSLFIACVLSAYGPWSAFEVSEQSQHNRLKELLVSNKMLKEDNAVAASSDVSFIERREISATVDYLIKMHGLHSIQSLFTVDLDSLVQAGAKKDEYIFKTGKVLAVLGIDYTYGFEEYESDKFFVFAVKDDGIIVTDGFKYALAFNIGSDFEKRSVSQEFIIDSNTVQLSFDHNDLIIITINKESDAEFELNTVLKKLKNDYGNKAYEIPAERIQFDIKGKHYSYRLLIRNVNASAEEGNEVPKISFMGGFLLVNGRVDSR